MVYFNEELYPIGMSGALFYWKGTVNIKLIGFSISIHSCLKLAYKPYQNLSFPVVAPERNDRCSPDIFVLNATFNPADLILPILPHCSGGRAEGVFLYPPGNPVSFHHILERTYWEADSGRISLQLQSVSV